MPDTFIGKPWNTDMPTIGRGVRVCPACGQEVFVERIVAYEEEENWTCPRGACKARVTMKAPTGRYGSQVVPDKAERPDRGRETADFKRQDPRRYRSKRWRAEHGEEEG